MPEKTVKRQKSSQGINTAAVTHREHETVYKADELKVMQDSLVTGSRLIDSMKTTASMSQWAQNYTIPDQATLESSYESSRTEAFKNTPVMDSHRHKRKKHFMSKAGDQAAAAGIVRKILSDREEAKKEFLTQKKDINVEEKDVSFAEDWSAYYSTYSKPKPGEVDHRYDQLGDLFSADKTKQKEAALTMLRNIRILDLKQFEFEDDKQFMLKFNDYYKELCACSNAQKLLDIVDTGMVDKANVKLKAKIQALNEIREAYENRMQILQSPYYALLMESDLKQGDPKYEELKEKMKDNAGAKAYFDAVEKKKALKFGKGMNAEDLYKSHLKESEDYKKIQEHEAFEKKKEGFLEKGLKAKEYPAELLNIRVCTDAFYLKMTEKVPTDKAEYLNKIEEIIQAYSELNGSYEKYIQLFYEKDFVTKDEAAAMELAEELLSQYKNEQRIFALAKKNAMTDFDEHVEESWENVLYNVRIVKVDRKDKDIETVGAGTSVIYKVKDKDGSVDFVKKEERMINPKNTQQMAEYLLDSDPLVKEFILRLDNEFEKLGKDHRSFMGKAIKSFVSVATMESVPVYEENATPEQISAQDKEYMRRVLNLFESELGDLGRACNNTFKENESFFSAFKQMMSLVGKKLNEYNVAKKVALVKEDSCISDRNAATSVMAERLGISDIVAESKTVLVETETGELVKANAMEQVDGIEFGTFMDKAAGEQAKVEYSPEALGQMFTMQVFDMICGQVDRNNSNYMVTDYEIRKQLVGGREEEVRVIKSIKAIDNDMSFGLLSSEVIHDNHREMRGFDTKDFTCGYIKFLPKEFIDKIKAYDDLNAVKADFAGLRSEEEIKALYERIHAVREEMEKRLASDDPDNRILQYENADELKEKYKQMLEGGVFERAKATLGTEITQFVQWKCIESLPKEGEEKPQILQTIQEDPVEDTAMKQAHIEVESSKEELLNSKVKHGLITYSDSAMMDALKASIGDLNEELNKPVQRGNEFDKGKKPLVDAYTAVIENCRTYLKEKKNSRSKDGKRRLELVRQILEQSEREHAAFSKLTQKELRIDEYKLSRTWTDVLYGVRAVKVSGSDANIKVVGEGTSIIYRVKDEDGTTSYVKPEEKMAAKNTAGCIFSEYSLIAPPEMMDVIEWFQLSINRKQRFTEWLESDVLGEQMMDAMEQKSIIWHKGESEKDYKKRVEEGRYNAFKEILKTSLGGGSTPFNDLFRQKEAEFVKALQMFCKKSNEYYTATVKAHINPGEIISTRNVSTSRVAERLGIGEIVAASQTVLVQKEDGGIIRANSMEGAETKSLNELQAYCAIEGKTLTIAPKAINQIFSMQILDLICGQVDRHGGNYHVFYDETEENKVVITSIKAIDNDMSFGSGIRGLSQSGEYMCGLKGKYSGTKPSIPFLDKGLYDRIMNYTPQMAELDQADIRTHDEIEALQSRLTAIKDQLQEMVEKKEITLLESPEQWEEKADELKKMNDDGMIEESYLHIHKLWPKVQKKTN